MHKDCIAYDKHSCAMRINLQCIEFKLFMISIVMQCIGIALLMINIILQCIAYDKQSGAMV